MPWYLHKIFLTEIKEHVIFFTVFWPSFTGPRAEKIRMDFFHYLFLLQHALILLQNNFNRNQQTFFLTCLGPFSRAHGPKKLRLIFFIIFHFLSMPWYLHKIFFNRNHRTFYFFTVLWPSLTGPRAEKIKIDFFIIFSFFNMLWYFYKTTLKKVSLFYFILIDVGYRFLLIIAHKNKSLQSKKYYR